MWQNMRASLCGIACIWCASSSLTCFELRAKAATGEFHLEIMGGDNAINNVKHRSAREPIVRVTDENHHPVSGVAVSFHLPAAGPGAGFKSGSVVKTFVTNTKGIVKATGLRPNGVPGTFQIHVTASFQGHVVGTAVIAQTNTGAGVGASASVGASAGSTGGSSSSAASGSGAATSTGATTGTAGAASGAGAAAAAPAAATAAGAAGAGISAVTIGAIAAGAAVGGVVAVKVANGSKGNNSSPPPSPPTGSIGTPGAPTIGPALVGAGVAPALARFAPRVSLLGGVSDGSLRVPVILLRLAGNRYARLALTHWSFGAPVTGDRRGLTVRRVIRK